MNKVEVTPDQINEWKQKHGKVFLISVGDLKGYFRKPDRKTLSAAMKFGANDPMKFNETLANNCWLAGDEELRTEDDNFMAVSSQFGELVKVKDAEIKEL